MNFSAADHALMARAIALAANGRDTATPNPSVGCVIAKAGRIIGEGWHERAGEPHAEAKALAACAEAPEGATAYVTLEPCSHHGRTPPCADALIAARVSRVVTALEDPNPLVRGQGHARLRAAGVQVETGLLAAAAAETHRGYLARMSRGRPWMRIKAAASLDGRIALANGASRWITGEEARRDVHALRARSCAMLTGIGTVQSDDPELTVRHVACSRQPQRVVVDSRLDLLPGARILAGAPTLVLTVSEDREKRAALAAAGAEVVTVPSVGGKTDLMAVARLLGERGCNEVTVEAGARLNASLLQAGVIDEIVLYLAPLLLGNAAQGLFALPAFEQLAQGLRLDVTEVRVVGTDLRVTARLRN